jgi:creatinine amidohydrolase
VSRLLERWSSSDVAAERPVVAIPVGSCEQHGPHLPLGTDTMIAGALAERLAERRRAVPVLVGPALSVTSSGEHAGFAGTLSIGAAATGARRPRSSSPSTPNW